MTVVRYLKLIDKDLYGQQLAIRVIDFIRPEMKFSGIDDLKTQISLDAMRAKELLSEIRS
jgi:riboflavin kinase/FMN adenylyltransferase